MITQDDLDRDNSSLGELFVLMDNEIVLRFEDVSEFDGGWWCDALNDEEEPFDDSLGAPSWSSFNFSRVMGIEWVKYGAKRRYSGQIWEEA